MFLLNAQFSAVKYFRLSNYGLIFITGDYPSFSLSIAGELINTFTIDDPNPLFMEFEDCIYYSTFNGACYEINLHTRSKRLIDERYIAVIGSLQTKTGHKTFAQCSCTMFLQTKNEANSCYFYSILN